MDLKSALTNWESAVDQLTTLDTNLGTATNKVADIQTKLDAAQTDLGTAQTADDDGAASYNTATDALIAALGASKRTPPPTPISPAPAQ